MRTIQRSLTTTVPIALTLEARSSKEIQAHYGQDLRYGCHLCYRDYVGKVISTQQDGT